MKQKFACLLIVILGVVLVASGAEKIVGAADAISASRPGARSETMTTYIKSVQD